GLVRPRRRSLAEVASWRGRLVRWGRDARPTDARGTEPQPMVTTTATHSRLHDRLARETNAEVRFDDGYRWLYATDASLYQVEPIGVVVPRSRADLVAAVAIAAEEGVPVLPRGGATSLSGQ